MPNKYGPRLRQERERRGWSRNYVAEQIKVDVVTVGRWERGEQLPHPVYRQQLCDLFEMNAEDLGLFSELPQEHDTGATDADSSSKKDFFIGGGEPPVHVDSSEILDTMNEDTASFQVTPLPQEKTTQASSPWFRRRRSVLIGLGGLGVTALMGTAWQVALRASTRLSPPSAPLPLTLLNKPSQQLIDPGSTSWINRLSWSPDSRTIAAATGTNIITFWDREKEALIRDYTTLNAWVNDISWSKTDAIASANADRYHGSIEIWHYPAGTPAVTFQRPRGLRTVSWSPNGTYLAFAGHAITVEVWDPFALRRVSQYSYPALGSLGINRVKWSASGAFLACGTDDGTVHVWKALTGEPRTIYRGHRQVVLDVAWSPDERYIASASIDGTTQVWEALTGRLIVTYRGEIGQVECVDWSLQGKYIATGGTDRTAQIWEALTGRLVAKYEAINAVVETVLWSTDGTTVAIGTDKQGIELWPVPQ